MTASATSTYPGAVDTPVSPGPNDTLASNNVEHDLLHDWVQDAIRAIETKLGVDNSPLSTTVDYVLAHHQHLGGDRSAQLATLPIKMVALQSQNPLEVRTSANTLLSAITPAGEFLDVGATTTTLAVRSYVAGDTFDRFQVQADGKLLWGSGAAALGTSLARTGAGQLQLTSQLGIGVTPTTFALDVSGTARFSGAVTLGGGLSAPLAVAQGGTGSATQSFVDLTTAQTVAGVKTFSSAPVFSAPLGVASGGTGSATQNFVDLTAAQTIAGVKTFSSAPVVPAGSFPESAVANLITDLAAKATDSSIVHLAGTETITGAKTFSSAPAFSTPLPIASGGTGSATQNFVDLTAAQTINGVKTFSSAPVFSAPLPIVSGGTGSSTQNFVDLANTQTVTGAKTFSSTLSATGAMQAHLGLLNYGNNGATGYTVPVAFGIGGTSSGVAPGVTANTSLYKIQFGTSSVTLDASGNAVINFPTAFPNGLVAVVAMNGDSNNWGSAFVDINTQTLSSFTAHVEYTGGVLTNHAFRINWIAMGW